MIGSLPGSETRGRDERLVLGAIALGLLALATRQVSYSALGLTAAAGMVGLTLPVVDSGARATRRTWILTTGLGLAAFAFVRISGTAPVAPGGVWPAIATGLAGVAEEAFFRRLIFGRLVRRGAAVAVAGSAIAFAIVHVPLYGWGAVPLDLAAGLLLGWQRLVTGSWSAPAFTHFAANLMASL